jgi:hypothetical protein
LIENTSIICNFVVVVVNVGKKSRVYYFVRRLKQVASNKIFEFAEKKLNFSSLTTQQQQQQSQLI